MTIEALKKALEALEYIDNNYMSLPKIGNKSITALRAAIEVAEKQEPVLWQWKDSEMVSPFDKTNVEGWTPLYTTPSAAQPAPVQEPVAWCVLEPWLSGKFEAQDCFSDVALDANVGWVPLYTTPPAAQRQFVGLTDESVVSAAARVLSDRVAASCNVDCGDMWMLHGNDSIEDACAMLEAAEAKLKEKNT